MASTSIDLFRSSKSASKLDILIKKWRKTASANFSTDLPTFRHRIYQSSRLLSAPFPSPLARLKCFTYTDLKIYSHQNFLTKTDLKIYSHQNFLTKRRLGTSQGLLPVKVHTAIKDASTYTVMLYDRTLEVCVTFESRVMDELLEEFGVLCERKLMEKNFTFTVSWNATDSSDCSRMSFLTFKVGKFILSVNHENKVTLTATVF